MNAFRLIKRRANRNCGSSRADEANGKRRLILAGIGATALFSVAIQGWSQTTEPTSEPTPVPATQQSSPAAPGATATKFKKMSLDELMDVEVTSVSKRESTVGDSAAAITVVTQEDIRRTGARSIPEALRIVPGLEVAQIDSDSWGISSRGFNSQDANKLLVLIDGRSVYTPLFGGVFWDAQDTMMQDIDRIEVIRGSAGSLWGENAVNGVINVITKSAEETQGLLFSAGGGSLEREFTDARYGWKMGDDLYARIYVKHFERDQTLLPNGSGGGDAWQMTQAGFRLDWQPSKDNRLSVHGDIYGGYENNLFAANTSDTNLSGGNIVGLWTHDMGKSGDLKLQAYFDNTHHDMLPFSERRDTADIDFQYHVHLDPGQDVTCGLGYRLTSDRIGLGILPSETIGFDPDHRSTQVVSAFAQYEAEVVPDRLRLTIGSKFEHNDFSGFDVQPNARLLLKIDKQQSVWGAVSRAVRTPTRLDEDVVGTEVVAGTSLEILRGNPNFHPESVLSYELGYRVEPVKGLSLDVATFYNVYTHVESINNITSLAQLPIVFGNETHGDTYGVEVGSTLKATDWWTIRAAYTYLQKRLVADGNNVPVPQSVIAADDPSNQFFLRSSMDFPHHVQLDISARYVEELTVMQIPSYIAVDARLSWQPTDHLELSVVGKNLLDNQHPEFHGNYSTATILHEIPRSVYGMMTVRW